MGMMASDEMADPLDRTLQSPALADKVAEYIATHAPQEQQETFMRYFGVDDPNVVTTRTLKNVRSQTARPAKPRAALGNDWGYTATRSAALATTTGRQQQQQPHDAGGFFGVTGSRPTSAPPTQYALAVDVDPESPSLGAAAATPSGLPDGEQLTAGSFAASPRAARRHMPDTAHMTTNQALMSLSQLYPELYQYAVDGTRAKPFPNQTFVSEWGNSLKMGAAQAAKNYSRTTYETFNGQVHSGNDDYIRRRNEAFAAWVRRQRTYYGDLVKPEQAAFIDRVLAEGSVEEQQQVIGLFRSLYIAADQDSKKPHSHVEHRKMIKTEDPELTRLVKEQNKLRNFGTPNKPSSSVGSARSERPVTALGHHTPAAAAALAKLSGAGSRPLTASAVGSVAGSNKSGRSGKSSKADPKETFESRVPIKMARGFIGKVHSMYELAHGVAGAQEKMRSAGGRAEMPAAAKAATTTPFGAVNPATAAAPIQAAFAVPPYFVTRKPAPGERDRLGSIETTNKYFFGGSAMEPTPEYAAALEVSARLVEDRKKATGKSTLPWPGKLGMSNAADGEVFKSNYGGDFRQHRMDGAVENRAQAKALSELMSGATASGTALVGGSDNYGFAATQY